jgi:hypothetical protein
MKLSNSALPLLAAFALFGLPGCGPAPDATGPTAPADQWEVMADSLLAANSMQWGTIQVQGGSMRPFLWDGDWLLYDTTAWDRTVPGNDIVFEHPRIGLTVHRVTQRTNDLLTTKGINSGERDTGVVTKANYRGTVRGHLYRPAL